MTVISEPQQSNFSLSKFIIGFLILFLISYGLSYFYGVISAVMPWIYLNFICTVILGTALGYTTIFTGYITKQTHRISEIVLTVTAGLMAWYFSWVAYILQLSKYEVGSSFKAYFTNFILVFEPNEVFNIISRLNETGLWELGGGVIKGTMLSFIWIIEGLIIIGVPIILLLKQSQRPFSVTHNKWYKEYIIAKDFGSVYGIPSLEEDLRLNPVSTIEGFNFGSANRYTQVSIYFLEEEGIQYLSLFDIRIDREDKTEKNEIMHMLEISTQDAKAIMENWPSNKPLIPFL